MKSIAKKLLLVGLVVALLLAALLGVTRWRGQSALQRWIATQQAAGEKFTRAEVLPGYVPFTNAQILRLHQVVDQIGRHPIDPALLDGMSMFAPGRARIQWREPELSAGAGKVFAWADFAAQMASKSDVTEELRRIVTNSVPRDSGWDYTSFWSGPPNELIALRRATQWMWGATLDDLHRGDLGAAQEDLHALISLAGWREESWMLVDQMVRVAILQLTISAVWEALDAPGWDEARLAALQADLGRVKNLPQFGRTFEVERMLVMNVYDAARTNSSRKEVRNLIAPSGVTANVFSDSFYLPLWQTAWSHQDELFYLESMQPVVESIRHSQTNRSALELVTTLTNAEARIKQRLTPLHRFRYPLAPAAMANWSRALTHLMRGETMKQMALAAIAIKRYELRHGRPPESLAALLPEFLSVLPLDYMNGKPLRYRVEAGGGFTLYSVGVDGRDDGGDPAPVEPWKTSEVVWNGRDAVWPKPATGSPPPFVASSEVMPLIVLDGVPFADAIRNLARAAEISVKIDPATDLVMNSAWVKVRYTNCTVLEVLEMVLHSNRLTLVKVSGTNVVGVTRR